MQTFIFFRNIKRYHVSGDHSIESLQPEGEVVPVLPASVASSSSSVPYCDDNKSALVHEKHALSAVTGERITLVASLRANSSLSYSVLPQVIDSVNALSNCLISACEAAAVRSFSDCIAGNAGSDHLVQQFQSSLASRVRACREPLEFLGTKYRQDSFFSRHDSSVSPQSVIFGMRFETRCGRMKAVYDTFQYVSIQETLKALLMNEQYITRLMQVQTTPPNKESLVIYLTQSRD